MCLRFYEVYLSKDSGNTWEIIRTLKHPERREVLPLTGLQWWALLHIPQENCSHGDGEKFQCGFFVLLHSNRRTTLLLRIITEMTCIHSEWQHQPTASLCDRYMNMNPLCRCLCISYRSGGNPELIVLPAGFRIFNDGSQMHIHPIKEGIRRILMPEHLFIYDIGMGSTNRVIRIFRQQYPCLVAR